jgi:hypothetical protein
MGEEDMKGASGCVNAITVMVCLCGTIYLIWKVYQSGFFSTIVK